MHGLSKVSLVQQGNSMLRHKHTLILVHAVNDDGTTMFIQEEDYKQLMDNIGASSGFGSNQIARAYDDQQSQMAHTEEFSQIILNRKAVQMEAFNAENLDNFIPNKKARHKPHKGIGKNI